jgi:hypothetical protein
MYRTRQREKESREEKRKGEIGDKRDEKGRLGEEKHRSPREMLPTE